MSNFTGNFRRMAFRGGLITSAAQAIKIVIQVASTVVLARLLTPADFGLVAAVAPIVAFVALFQNLGLQQAVIQRKEVSGRQLDQVFWASALLGFICMLAIAALSPAVAAFYGDNRLTVITLALSLPVFLGSLAALPLSLMNRHLQFGQLAINDVAAALSGFAGAAGAAYAGLGYWSLVLSSIIAAVVGMLAAWRVAPHRPGKPRFEMDADILSFGLNLTGFNLANFFARNLDNVLIGKFAGPVQLGYYDRAYKLLLFPLQNLNAPITRVMIPMLSKIQDDKARVRNVYLRMTGVLAFVSIPGVAALAITSSETIHLLFGERWMDVAPIFAWLGLAGIIQPIANTTGCLLISQGLTKQMFRMGFLASLSAVVAFFAGLPWGGVGVAAAYAISIVLALPFRWWYLARHSPISFRDSAELQLPYFLAAGATLLLVHNAVAAVTESDAARVGMAVIISYSVALIAVSATRLGRATIREAFLVLRRAVGRRHH